MARKFNLAGILLAVLGLGLSVTAEGGSIIQQVVTTTVEKDVGTANYQWKIDGEKFKLKVSSGNGEVSYLFNGRNFYVCSKVGTELINQLTALNIADPQMLRDLSSGSCQAVPANFMARFFLSPAGAISTLDYSDGMELNLEMQNYGFTTAGQGQSNKESCSEASRNFEVTRKLDNSSGRYQKVDEKLCSTSKYDWRAPFWKQMSRNLIRQPSAKGLLKSLEVDNLKLQGFVLKSSGTFEKSDAKGAVRKGTRTIATTAIAEAAIPASEFSTPTGFVIIDVQSKILASKAVDSSTAKGSGIDKSAKADDAENPVSVILYYMLRGGL
jgi:hypothetical protein